MRANAKENRYLINSRRNSIPLSTKLKMRKTYSTYLIPFSVKKASMLQLFVESMMPAADLTKISLFYKESQYDQGLLQPKRKQDKKYLKKKILPACLEVCCLQIYWNKINSINIRELAPMWININLLVICLL